MFWISAIIIVLVPVYFFMEFYRLRYFFEKNFVATGFSADGMQFKKLSIWRKTPVTTVQWTDILSCNLIQGFDSSRWWFRNVKKTVGMNFVSRLAVNTKYHGTLVFHLLPPMAAPVERPLYKNLATFNKNGEILKEFEKHNIHVSSKEIPLIEAITDKRKDWYRQG